MRFSLNRIDAPAGNLTSLLCKDAILFQAIAYTVSGIVHTLAQLRPGESGRVVAVGGDDAVSVRLLELGLLPGEALQVLGVAPLGDPLSISLRGTRLAIRRSDAARVQLANGHSSAASASRS